MITTIQTLHPGGPRICGDHICTSSEYSKIQQVLSQAQMRGGRSAPSHTSTSATPSNAPVESYPTPGIVNTKSTPTVSQVHNMSQEQTSLPPYPNEPDVNPGFENHTSNFYPPKVVKVTDGVYDAIGYGMANSVMIVGNDGIIIIDTLGSYDTAKQDSERI